MRTFETVVEEDPVTGDYFIKFPDELMIELDWRVGDNLQLVILENEENLTLKNLSLEERQNEKTD